MSTLSSQLDELWESQGLDGWAWEENAGPLAMKRRAARQWLPDGPSTHYAWLYFRRDDASALIVKGSRDSVFLQSQGGMRRLVIVEQGGARMWVGGTHLTIMERDRVWIDRDLYHLIEPLTPKIVFELICWPEIVGLPSDYVQQPAIKAAQFESTERIA